MKRPEAVCYLAIIVVALIIFNWKGCDEKPNHGSINGNERAGDFISTIMPERAEPERVKPAINPEDITVLAHGLVMVKGHLCTLNFGEWQCIRLY
jgi:hypothetical protein